MGPEFVLRGYPRRIARAVVDAMVPRWPEFDVDLTDVTVRNCRVEGFLYGIKVTRDGFRDLADGEEFEHSTARILLAGIALNALGGALLGLLLFFSGDGALRAITVWTLGSLGGATWGRLAVALPQAVAVANAHFPAQVVEADDGQTVVF